MKQKKLDEEGGRVNGVGGGEGWWEVGTPVSDVCVACQDGLFDVHVCLPLFVCLCIPFTKTRI